MESSQTGKLNFALSSLFALFENYEEDKCGSYIADIIDSFYKANARVGDYKGYRDKLAMLLGYLVVETSSSLLAYSIYSNLADNTM